MERRPGALTFASWDGSFKGGRPLADTPRQPQGRDGHSGSMTLLLREVSGNTVIVDDPKDSLVREGCLSVHSPTLGILARLQRVPANATASSINACCNKCSMCF